MVAVVAVAIFTDAFIYGMIVPIIPVVLVDRIDGAREEDAQSWVSILLAVYGATLLVGSPLFGWFADRCQHRRSPFVLGLIALGASTLLFVIARSPAVLIIARSLQGLSAAAVWVVGLAIIADNVPQERVGEAMGQTTIALTWGFLLGPIAGGIMFEKVGFYATFAIPTGLIVLEVVLRLAMLEVPKPVQGKDIVRSQGTGALSDGYDTFSRRGSWQTENTRTRHDHNEQTSLLRPSTPCTGNSCSNDHQPANIFHLLRTPRLPLACTATVVMAVVFSAIETTIPLHVMDTFGWSSTGVGLILIAPSIPSFAGVYIGRLISRVGVRIPAGVAFLLSGLVWISMRFVNNSVAFDIGLLIGLLVMLGLAIVTVEITSMTEVSQVVVDYETDNPGAFGEKNPVAQAYALYNMAFAGGQLLGPILAGGIRIRAGWSAMTLVLGLLCAVTAIPMGLLSGSQSRRVEAEAERDS